MRRSTSKKYEIHSFSRRSTSGPRCGGSSVVTEGSPRLQHLAETTASLAEGEPVDR